ncbi:uncharacterized protein LOC114269846 [Camellia sinensis]|uniref:uncharacterized protein LOC114269846 n=1 Tax=Camellia sinensis TaxID=4442 RepID=UPI00103596CE|nr:uncharacterized protein LOC114269846 [Camellia sinensis]
MRRSLGKHCAHHNEDGHLTQGCRALKTHLEDLVRQGHLRDLLDKARTREEQARLSQALTVPPSLAPQPQEDGSRVINVIHSKVNENEVQQKRPRVDEGPMVFFTETDLDMVQHPDNEALVISLKIEECQIRRILVDQGSFYDIMYVRRYKELGHYQDDLEQSNSPMVGFNRMPTWPLGAISLEEQVGTKKSMKLRKSEEIKCRQRIAPRQQ